MHKITEFAEYTQRPPTEITLQDFFAWCGASMEQLPIFGNFRKYNISIAQEKEIRDKHKSISYKKGEAKKLCQEYGISQAVLHRIVTPI